MKITNTASRLQEYMSLTHTTQADLLRLCEPVAIQAGMKLSSSKLSQYCTGKFDPKQDMLYVFGKALHVSEVWLMGYDVPMRKGDPQNMYPVVNTAKTIPLIGDIACGTPILADQNIEDYLPAVPGMSADFALRCHGDSMKEAGIFDNDIVYIHCQVSVDNGTIAAVRIGDEATIKRVFVEPSKITLSPCNKSYMPKIYQGLQMADVHIIGRVVGTTRVF